MNQEYYVDFVYNICQKYYVDLVYIMPQEYYVIVVTLQVKSFRKFLQQTLFYILVQRKIIYEFLWNR